MDTKLCQLIEIFEDKTVDQLSKILKKFNGDVDIAIDWIISSKNEGKVIDKRKVKGDSILSFVRKENVKVEDLEIIEIDEGSTVKEVIKLHTEEDRPKDGSSVLNEIPFEMEDNQYKTIKVEEGEEDDIEAELINHQIKSSENWKEIFNSNSYDVSKEVAKIDTIYETSTQWSSILKREPTSPSTAPTKRFSKPILTLYTPLQVKTHLPNVRMYTNFLPTDLASSLFDSLLIESKTWNPYQLYMFERLVESKHLTHSYCSRIGEFPSSKYFKDNLEIEVKPTFYFENLEKVAKVIEDFINLKRLDHDR